MSQIFPSRITLALVPESGVTVYVQDIGMSDLTDIVCLGSNSSFLYTRLECIMSLHVYGFTLTILTQVF